MKTQSLPFRSFGVLVALLMFVSTAFAVPCYPSYDPYCELYYGTGNQLFLELETECPTWATLFVKTAIDSGYPAGDPCHVGATPCAGTSALANGTKLSIPYGHTLYVKVLAWSSSTGDSGITTCDQHNPNW
jgi:hypothetical protein